SHLSLSTPVYFSSLLSFPTRRSSDLYLSKRSDAFHVFIYAPFQERVRRLQAAGKSEKEAMELAEVVDRERADFINKYFDVAPFLDRKSTRLNSSHGSISYAVFCLQKQ